MELMEVFGYTKSCTFRGGIGEQGMHVDAGQASVECRGGRDHVNSQELHPLKNWMTTETGVHVCDEE